MQRIVRIFVSSTWLDLQPERKAVEKALQRLRQTKLNGMEYIGSLEENTRQASLDAVALYGAPCSVTGGGSFTG